MPPRHTVPPTSFTASMACWIARETLNSCRRRGTLLRYGCSRVSGLSGLGAAGFGKRQRPRSSPALRRCAPGPTGRSVRSASRRSTVTCRGGYRGCEMPWITTTSMPLGPRVRSCRSSTRAPTRGVGGARTSGCRCCVVQGAFEHDLQLRSSAAEQVRHPQELHYRVGIFSGSVMPSPRQVNRSSPTTVHVGTRSATCSATSIGPMSLRANSGSEE